MARMKAGASAWSCCAADGHSDHLYPSETGKPSLLPPQPVAVRVVGQTSEVADTKMIKSAGEHWVCSVLARLGWGAALTRDGLERTDILAVQAGRERRMVEIQVKTATYSGPRTTWLVNEKAQQRSLSAREWFIFVLVPREPWGLPRSFVVPRDHVSAATWIFHQNWLTEPNVPPGTRNMPLDRARMGVDVWEGYEERWDLLDLSATDAPVLLPTRARQLALEPRVGVPTDHPWSEYLPEW